MIDEGPPLQVPVIPPAVFDAVSKALLEGRALGLRYESLSKQRINEYVVHPLALVWRGPVAYLVVLFSEYSDPRYVALQRFLTVQVLDQPARTLAGFDLDEFLAQYGFDLPLDTGIALHADIAEDVAMLLRERPLAPDQRLEPVGANRFALRATVTDTMRLRWWLLSFGDRITVRAPTRLREEMMATIRRMAAAYDETESRDDRENTGSIAAGAAG